MLPTVVVRAKDLCPSTIQTMLATITAPHASANPSFRNLAAITTSLPRTATLEQILERRAQKEKRRPSLDGVFLLRSCLPHSDLFHPDRRRRSVHVFRSNSHAVERTPD